MCFSDQDLPSEWAYEFINKYKVFSCSGIEIIFHLVENLVYRIHSVITSIYLYEIMIFIFAKEMMISFVNLLADEVQTK